MTSISIFRLIAVALLWRGRIRRFLKVFAMDGREYDGSSCLLRAAGGWAGHTAAGAPGPAVPLLAH